MAKSRHSFVSLLIAEGRSIVDVARQAGHSATMALDTYGHVFDELDGTESISAEDAIREARADLVRTAPVSVASAKNKALRSAVATSGNGFGLLLRLRRRCDLPLIATSCNHGAPQRLHPKSSILTTTDPGGGINAQRFPHATVDL
jgi:hypothetical protein